MTWWAWALAGLALLGAELAFGGKVLLGFVIGAGVMAAQAWLGWPVRIESAAAALLVFAALSLAAWIALRLALGVRKGQVKRFDTDIND